MPADLLDDEPPDVEDFLCCWLAPLIRTATERRPDDPLPFCVVARIAGTDDIDEGRDDPVVQLDIFDTARGGLLAPQAAGVTKRDVHRRMNYLARHLDTNVTMSDGSTANAETVATVLKPFRMKYPDDTIVRYVARYQLGLAYVAL